MLLWSGRWNVEIHGMSGLLDDRTCCLLARWLWAPWSIAINTCGVVGFWCAPLSLSFYAQFFVACLGPPIDHHRSRNLPPMWIACSQRGGTKDEASKSIHGQRLVETLARGAYVWLGSALLFGELIFFTGPVQLRVEYVENI